MCALLLRRHRVELGFGRFRQGLQVAPVFQRRHRSHHPTFLLCVIRICAAQYGYPATLVHPQNVNGGAIALGHPLGSSGSRIVISMLGHLERTGGRYGIASLCIGVGQGAAMVIERLEPRKTMRPFFMES